LEALEDRCVPSTVNVTSNADNGAAGTLRWAVTQGAGTIDILTTQPIVLTRGEINLNNNVTIEAPAANPATISGNGHSRVFEVSAAYVTLSYLNITGGNGVANNPSGNAGLDGLGGAILNDGNDLMVFSCTLSGNKAQKGGAIYNSTPELVVWNSTFADNTATQSGGAIYSVSGTVEVGATSDSGRVPVQISTVSNNSAINQGGGIYIAGGYLNFAGIVSGNAAMEGGGIFIANGRATLRSSTVSGNSATDGGGIYIQSGGVNLWVGSTISNNSATDHGGGVYNANIANESLILWNVGGISPMFSANSPDDIFGTYSIATYHRPRSY
jgi:predicted outer membrane repeat protein